MTQNENMIGAYAGAYEREESAGFNAGWVSAREDALEMYAGKTYKHLIFKQEAGDYVGLP